jgi:large subunit ribosomal protein L3
MGFSPRKRAPHHVPKFDSWPETSEGPRIQGFAGYKVGMTHVFFNDKKETSMTFGQEVRVAVTVIEVPPMKVAAIRVYGNSLDGLQSLGEVWAKKVDSELSRRLPLPKKIKSSLDDFKEEDVEDVRLITHTQPVLVKGLPKKAPDIMEVRVGGGTVSERLDFAKSLLGKEITIKDFAKEGACIDISAITKGKGFGGHIKRWGVKLLSHKNDKHRRMIGTLGPHFPSYILPSVPQAGQIGYHQRTEFNKIILKIGENGEEVNPSGGFLNYGEVENPYVIIHGSVPGPSKRLVRFRDPMRQKVVRTEEPEITYISQKSHQGG